MRKALRILTLVLGALVAAVAVWFVVQKAVPFQLRVGMSWAEAERTLSWVVHRRVRSGARRGGPINDKTGELEYHERSHPIELPDATCIFIWLRAPYDATRGWAGFHDADYWIASFEVGPRFSGFPEDFAWGGLPKKHPAVVDVSWCSWPAIGAFVVGLVVAAILVPRLVRRLGRKLPEKS